MTLGCLAPYRRLGIGTKMLKHVMEIIQNDGNFDAVVLHVQINNEGALEFYKKFGFEIVETKKAYYKRIEPADAHVLEKKIDKKAVKIGRATSELQSHHDLVCRLLLEKKKKKL